MYDSGAIETGVGAIDNRTGSTDGRDDSTIGDDRNGATDDVKSADRICAVAFGASLFAKCGRVDN